MLIVETLPILRRELRRWREANQRIALFSATGNLHKGHLQVICEAKNAADVVIVCLFANPMRHISKQERIYAPQRLQEDCEQLSKLDIPLVFAPSREFIFPEGREQSTVVALPAWERIIRPLLPEQNLSGYLTFTSKLLNIIQPDLLCIGETLYPFRLALEQMLSDLGYGVPLLTFPVARNHDGVPFSHDYTQLSQEQQQQAIVLSDSLQYLVNQLDLGERRVENLLAQVRQEWLNSGLVPTLIHILDADTLEALTVNSQHAVILLASTFGAVTLRDQAVVNLLD